MDNAGLDQAILRFFRDDIGGILVTDEAGNAVKAQEGSEEAGSIQVSKLDQTAPKVEGKAKEAAFRWMDYLVNEGQEILVNQYLEYMPSLADMELNVRGLNDDGKKNLEYIVENGKTKIAMVEFTQKYENRQSG